MASWDGLVVWSLRDLVYSVFLVPSNVVHSYDEPVNQSHRPPELKLMLTRYFHNESKQASSQKPPSQLSTRDLCSLPALLRG